MINHLISTDCAWAQIRSALSAILATETANQSTLAAAAGIEAAPYHVRVFEERANPWEAFRDNADARPVVNVWYDVSNPFQRASGHAGRMTLRSTYNVDCYARGVSAARPGGHEAGDEAASKAAQAAATFAQRVIMADTYMYLGLRGTVGRRNIVEVKTFQPDGENAVKVAAVRLRVEVEHNEYTVEHKPERLDEVFVGVSRETDGRVLFSASYDYSEN